MFDGSDASITVPCVPTSIGPGWHVIMFTRSDEVRCYINGELIEKEEVKSLKQDWFKNGF